MARSKIEWTDETWNPVSGCSKVSQGCKHCYAERHWARLAAPGQPYAGRSFRHVQCHPERLVAPLRWRKPRKVFVNSMSDLFHEDVADDFISQIFAVMALAPQHRFQILTKRPERMRDYLLREKTPGDIHRAMVIVPNERTRNARDRYFGGLTAKHWPLENVWLGVSVEDQSTAAYRIPLLLETPAAIRFVSAEPLLQQVNLRQLGADAAGHPRWCQIDALTGRQSDMGPPCSNLPVSLNWVVCGGESGWPGAKPMHPAWVRSLRDQCIAANVPFFFKQWGEWAPQGTAAETGDRYLRTEVLAFADMKPQPMYRYGKRLAGRLLDGQTWDAYPALAGADSDIGDRGPAEQPTAADTHHGQEHGDTAA